MENYPITIFHDGSCPICRLDIENLRARDDRGGCVLSILRHRTSSRPPMA